MTTRGGVLETGKTSGDIGGIPRRKYWTPDGREIKAIPAMRTYVKRDASKKIIESGTRDANLDQGWLTSKPVNPLPYCSGCDRWHDTQELVNECIRRKEKLHFKFQKLAEKELKIEPDRITKLEGDMNEIKNLLKKFLEK